jgi:hypothetical protein
MQPPSPKGELFVEYNIYKYALIKVEQRYAVQECDARMLNRINKACNKK